MTDYEQWLATLKPGDSWHCVIAIDFSGMRVARAEVIRLTNKQIVCGLDGIERRFRKDDGRAIGGWSLHKLPQPATVGELRNARAAQFAQLPRLLASVTRSEAMSWPDETVEQIAQLILEARRKNAEARTNAQ